MKRKTNLNDYNNINNNGVQMLEVASIAFDVPPTSKRLPGCKKTKKDQKASKVAKSSSINAQVRAIANMAVAIVGMNYHHTRPKHDGPIFHF